MRDCDFTKLLKHAAALAAQHQEVSARITDAFNERYGATHSDTDDDELIDALDYGQGHPRNFNAAWVDAKMAEYGHSKKPSQ